MTLSATGILIVIMACGIFLYLVARWYLKDEADYIESKDHTLDLYNLGRKKK